MKIQTVKHNCTGGFLVNGVYGVPDDPGNSDRQHIQAWIDAGGAIEPADIVVPDYRRLREREYPKVGDQLDVLWKQFNQLRLDGQPLIQEADDMLGSILATKAKYPKPV